MPFSRASSSSVGRSATATVTRAALALADQLDRHARADRLLRDQVGERRVRRHRLAGDADDDVALLDAGAGGRAARGDRADQLAAIAVDAERGGDALVDVLHADADIAALDALAAAQLLDHRRDLLGGNGEADADIAAGRRDRARC